MRFATLFLLLVATISCHAEDPGNAALLSISGQGVVHAEPDLAVVTVGVTTWRKDPSTAVLANNEAMNSLHNALDRFGIEAQDRRSRGFNVQPRYDHRRNDDNTPVITGYTVSNQVSMRVRKLDDLGDLLGAVVASGSNTIHSLLFDNADREELLDEARRLAIRNARHKASLYAEAAGGKAGRIVSVSEASAPQPQPERYNAGAMLADAYAVPIAAGENEYRATVNVVFEFQQ